MEDILEVVSLAAKMAEEKGKKRDIEQIIGFVKARLTVIMGEIFVSIISSHINSDSDLVPNLTSASTGDIIEQSARCFEIIARRELLPGEKDA